MARRRKSTSGKVKVDFTGVEGRINVPSGEYPARIKSVSKETASSGNDMLVWKIEITDGEKAGTVLSYNTVLVPQALWNLRNLLETLGVQVPDSEMDLDLGAYEGLELMIIVERETVDGKKRSSIVDFYPADEEADDEDDEAEEEEEEDEEEEEEEEDEEEEEETPKKSSRKSSRKSKKATKAEKVSSDDVKDLDEEELEALVDKYDLDVDLSKAKTLRKKQNMVIDALEEADLLED